MSEAIYIFSSLVPLYITLSFLPLFLLSLLSSSPSLPLFLFLLGLLFSPYSLLFLHILFSLPPSSISTPSLSLKVGGDRISSSSLRPKNSPFGCLALVTGHTHSTQTTSAKRLHFLPTTSQVVELRSPFVQEAAILNREGRGTEILTR